MSSEKIPPIDGAEGGAEQEAETQEIARMHSPETPESTLVSQEAQYEEAKVIEPPQVIENVSEVVGIALPEKEEINMLGSVSRDLRRASMVLERIKALTPEQIKPREVALIDERTEYIENFIRETREVKDEATREGVAILRALPNAKEIEDAVSLDDEATIAELTLRKKDKDQPLSKEEESALFRSFKNRDRFFDQLKSLGIEKDSARELYHRMISEKSIELRSHIPTGVSSARRIAETTELIHQVPEIKASIEAEATTPARPEDVITPFLTPEVLAAIAELNAQPTDDEKEDLNALRDETDIEKMLKDIPETAWNYQTPNIDESASPEILEALKRDGIHVKEGKKLTALQALILRRNVLGKRGTDDIARTQARIAENARRKREAEAGREVSASPATTPLPEALPLSVPSVEGMTVEDLEVEEIVIPPVGEVSSPRTVEARRQKGRELLSWDDEPLGRTPEMRRQKGRELLGADVEELSLSQIKEQIILLEAQPSRTEEEEEKLKGLHWLYDNAEANGFRESGIDPDDVIKEIESLMPKAILSSESKVAIAQALKYIAPGDSQIMEKDEALALGTEEEREVRRAFEERWGNFMNALEALGIDPDVAEKVHLKFSKQLDAKALMSPSKEIEARVITEYSERFNIGKEVLENIPGFSELTSGQQLLVLENFKKTAAQDVSVEGLKTYKEDLAKSGFWGRAWKNMTKQYQLGKAKGAVAEEWREGGSKEALAMKRDTLEGLTKLALTQKEFDVIEKDGTLQMEFAREELFKGKELSDEEKNTLTRFNDAANRYANLDFTGMEGEKEDFRESVEKEYQTALESVTQIYAEYDTAAGVEWQHKVRSAVQMNRFFADNPELEKDLDRSAGMTALLSGMNTLTERGTIAGVGVGLRVGAVSMLGTAGLFVAAPFVGGFLGARRAKQSIAEKDLLARMGEYDTSDEKKHERSEIENMQGAKNVINEGDVAKNTIDAHMLINRLSSTLREINEVNETQTVERAKRDETGALLRNEKGEVIKEVVSKREQLLSSLDARIEYTKRKLEEELVNLGGTNTIRITAINDLMEALGRAESLVAFEDPHNKNLLTERLDNLLDIRKEKIEDNRKYLVRKEAAKGAALAVGFAAAGTGIGWAIRHGIDSGFFGGGAKLSEEVMSTGKTPSGDIPRVEGAAVPSLEKMNEFPGGGEYVRNFNDTISHVIGANTTRAPLSIEELYALRQTAGLEGPEGLNTEAHSILIAEMSKSKDALSNEAIERIMANYKNYVSGVIDTPSVEVAPPIDLESGSALSGTIAARVLESTPKVYAAESGDTLTSILKEHVSEVRALSSDGQENAIQNFLRSLSPEDLREIGVTDPDKIAIGQSLNLEKVVQLLHEKQVGGVDILKHAEILTTPKGEIFESGVMDQSGVATDAAPGIVQDAVTPSSPEAVTPPRETPGMLHMPSREEAVVGSGSDTSEHITSARVNWQSLPESTRLLEADTTAQQYLENDIATLYGPKSKFGYFPREWTSIAARNANAVLTQTKETDPSSLLSDADEIPPGYEWANVGKMQQYLREQGFTKENGFVPKEKESIAEFIKRAHAAKIMNEGPTRSVQGK
ncbi:MAG: hypothetical protein A2494_02875 [Candidatus Lloydbacteria bacterium RIFOXYC12_FULL_46_25]|uniref:Uncharacterized protein n=1 Tax=Candidatus Lloydbacteria bacterium RIFOXYC12_FULL_46_25 TaxID=1798670 RepID=A0A1G2DXY3_9BACT|nr:MAG: hypothetical protein A2494_02875 [Candidatus Lloydbacteria bacterium RIFOXYC12_FULL_46_25]